MSEQQQFQSIHFSSANSAVGMARTILRERNNTDQGIPITIHPIAEEQIRKAYAAVEKGVAELAKTQELSLIHI